MSGQSRRRRGALLALLAGLLCAGPSAAQQQQQQQQQQQPAPPQPPQPPQTPAPLRSPQAFGATVARVRVDVIVTGEDGAFVTDLRPEDFEVYEDGAAQQILDAELVDLAEGEVRSLGAEGLGAGSRPVSSVDGAAAGGATPPGATTASNGTTATTAAAAAANASGIGGTASPRATPATAARASDAAGAGRSTAADLGAVIFLIDGPGLNQQAKGRFGAAWGDLLEQTSTLDVPRAAYMVDNVGRLRELAPLGADRAAMHAAAETVRNAPLFGNTINRRLYEIVDDLTSPAFQGAGEDLRQAAVAKARSFELEERTRALATYTLLTGFADALSSRSGRTAVVWVSSGIKLMQGGVFAALFASAAPSATAEGMGGAAFDMFSPDPQIKAAQEALHRAANSANVSFYSVDPALLSESRFVAADAELASAAAAAMLSTQEVQSSLDGLRDALRSAAAETGGRAFIHATDLGAALEEIEADTSRFYLLTYEPPAPEGDGKYHAIRVTVRRQGVRVRARGGYVDHPPEERRRRLIGAALALPGAVSGLDVRAQAFVSRPPGGADNVLLAVAVDSEGLGITVDGAGDRHLSLDIHSVALAAGGAVDEAHEQLSARSGGGAAGASGASTPAPALVGTMTYQREWTLAPGSYTFHVAVLDNASGRIGATAVDVVVPEATGGWGICDPLLVTIDEHGRIHPVVGGRVRAGESIAAFVEVYEGVQPMLSGEIFLQTDDGDSPQSARLLPMPLQPVAVGLHRGSTPLPPGLPTGRYTVQLAVTDPGAGQHRIVRLTLDVVTPPPR